MSTYFFLHILVFKDKERKTIDNIKGTKMFKHKSYEWNNINLLSKIIWFPSTFALEIIKFFERSKILTLSKLFGLNPEFIATTKEELMYLKGEK